MTHSNLELALIREPLLVSPQTRLLDAIIRMSEARSSCSLISSLANHDINPSCVLVVEGEKVIGILTERDIVRLLAEQQHFEELKIENVMSSPVLTAKESELTNLFETIHFLQQNHLRHLPIVDEEDRLVGLVTSDSLRHICRPIDLLRLRLVSEIMTTEVITTTPDTSLLAIAQMMTTHQVSCIVMVTSAGQPIGIITERDFVQFQTLGLSLTTYRGETVMSTPIFSIKPDDSVWEVQQMLEKYLIRRLVVIGKQGQLCGIVTQTDLLKALNPFELYKLTEILQTKVEQLEAEKVILLENRNLELEAQVAERTAAIKTQAEREKLLAEIATQIRSSLSLETILKTTVTEVKQLLQCDRVRIWQLINSCEIMLVAEAADSPSLLIRQRIRETCFQDFQYLNSGQLPIRVVSDINTTEMSDCHRQMLIDLQIRAKILVPLYSGDHLWGLLQATESQISRNWQPEEVELLRVLSEQLGIAIQQGTIHQQLEEELAKRKEIELKLRESEENYANLSAAAPVGIFRTDINGVCTYVNPRYCEITGLTLESAKGEGWQQGLHPSDRDWIIAQWQRFIQKKQDFQLEYRFQHSDGNITWVYGQAVAERDNQGEIIGYVGTITDISTNKKFEQQLRASEQLYASLALCAPVGIFRTDASGNCIYVNERWCQISGLAPDAARGDGWIHGLYPEDRGLVFAEWEQSVQENRPFQLEYRFQRSDGQITYVYGQSVAELNDQGEIIGYVGTITDITSRKQAELEREQVTQELETLNQQLEQKIAERTEALKNSEERWQLALKGTNDGIWDWNVLTNCVFFSSRWKEMRGYNEDEISDALEEWSKSIHPEDYDRVMSLVADHFAGKTEFFEAEYRVKHKNGSYIWILDRGQGLRDQSGQVIRMSGSETDITERKRMDASLQNLNEALRYAVEGISRLDTQGRYLSVNPAYASICGYQQEEMISMYWTLTVHPDDIPQLEAAYQYMIENDKVEAEARGIRKDGSIFYKQVTMVTAYDEMGNFSGHHCFMKDISDRKKAELALQESENRFRRVFDSNVVGMIFADFHGNITDANDRFLDMLGYTREDLQENRINWANMTPPEYQQQDLDAIAHLRLYGEITPWEKVYYHKDGHQVPVIVGVAFLSDDREKGDTVCVILDISELKQAQIALEQQANREHLINAISQRIRASLNLQDILNTTVAEVHQILWTDRVLVYRLLPDGQGKVIAESVSADYTPLLDQLFSKEIFPQVNYERYLQGRIFALTDRENGTIPDCLVDFMREIGVISKLVVPIIENKTLWGLLIAHQCEQSRQWQTWEIELLGQLSSQLAIAIQQSELYAQLQENHLKLLHTNEELARATRLKDEFLANMSHELRTPLNAILGLTEGLQESVFGELNQEQRKILQTIERSGSHLLELINDILDVAKIESGQLELDWNFTAIAPLCQSSITFIKQQALKKQIHLKIDIPGNLPDLWIDERRIRQVLINLLNNAVKFTPEGGQITLTVNRHRQAIQHEPPPLAGITKVRIHRTPWEHEMGIRSDEDYLSVKHYIQISIRDTGIGIAPENINKLFQPFIQIDSALNRQYAGTGLGLALVKRIVELHGGDVTLTSELGKGSCFTINLPYLPVETHLSVPNDSPQSKIELNQSETISIDNQTPQSLPLILLAEDNEANINTVSSYLKAKGYRLISAKNGKEALEIVESEHPDIILMDIQMPGMDGLEAIKIIRHQLKLEKIPIIALTALAMEGDREKCLAAGANEYLSKPIKMKNLVDMIQNLLDK